MFVFLSVSNTSFGQTKVGGIKGKVLDEKGEPLPFANVVAKQKGNIITGTHTDFDGHFMIKSLQPGNYDLEASFVGYKSVNITGVVVKSDQLTFQDFKFTSEAVVLLESVLCYEYAVPLIDKDNTISGNTVTRSDIKNLPGRSATDVAKTVGGVYSQNYGQSNLNGRGAREDASFVYIDGIKMRTQVEVEEIDDNPLFSQLTATEINDFSKWELWKDIKEKDLKHVQELWSIYPQKRFSILVKTKDNKAVIDASVRLKLINGPVLFTSKTDNTGKAELWLNLFQKESLVKMKNLEILVNYNGQEFIYEKPKSIEQGTNVLKIPVACEIPNSIDIAFVVDATGSMDDEIDFLKQDLIDIIQNTKDNAKNSNVRLASLFYKCKGNSYVTKHADFTPDIDLAMQFINQQNANEGGDEVVEEALQIAVDSLEWADNARARILFFVLDEQPLTNSDVLEKLKYDILKAAEKGIRVVPVISSAETMSHAASLEYLMRSIALATNGTYVALTDHSNIGNSHAKPVTDKYNVEHLNALIKRIIYQYTYSSGCQKDIEHNVFDTITVFNSPIIAQEVIDSSRTIHSKPTQMFTKEYSASSPDDTLKLLLADSIKTSTSVQEKENMKVTFYPNPTSGQITIDLYGDIQELFLTDISGKLLYTYNTKQKSQLKIDISNYSHGIYFLQCIDTQNNPFSGKVILTD